MLGSRDGRRRRGRVTPRSRRPATQARTMGIT
jgi:hypothetical protein